VAEPGHARRPAQIRTDVARAGAKPTPLLQTGYVLPPGDLEPVPFEDDTLALMYMCCHPSLATSSAIALTLRAAGGLTTAEIARAFLVPESTMAQRIKARQTDHPSSVAAEAIRLARIVHKQLPGQPEVAGLLALMLLTDARRHANS